MIQPYFPRVILTAAVLILAVVCPHATAQAPASPIDPPVAALRAALTKNAAHARDWLDQKDFKSLVQSCGTLQLLAELLKARSDDAAWQTATAKVASAVGDLQAAARGEDSVKILAAIESLEKSAAAIASIVPAGKPLPLPRGAGLRPLMMTMGGVYADAKIALIGGNVATAKNQALVLSELGKLVSNSRSGEPWTARASAFTEAALAAATSQETDPQKVRQLLRGISQRCDACHEMRNAAR